MDKRAMKPTGLPYVMQFTANHAGNDDQDVLRQCKANGDFVVESLRVAYASNAATLTLTDETRGTEPLQSGALVPLVMGGTGQYPLLLDEPYLVPSGGQLRLKSTNASGAANPVRLALAGRIIPRGSYPQYANRFPFWMRFASVLAANGSDPVSAQVPRGRKLEVYGFLISCTSIALTIDIKTTGLGPWFSDPVHAQNLCGTAAAAGRLPRLTGQSRRFPISDADQVTVTLQDLSGAGNTVNFYLFGTLTR
jgi:hypothetical protein